jgi:hypothetical protein
MKELTWNYHIQAMKFMLGLKNNYTQQIIQQHFSSFDIRLINYILPSIGFL